MLSYRGLFMLSHILHPPLILRTQLIAAIEKRDYDKINNLVPQVKYGWDLCATTSANMGDLNMLKYAESHGAKNYNEWMEWASMGSKMNTFYYAVDKGGNSFGKCMRIAKANDCPAIYHFCEAQLSE